MGRRDRSIFGHLGFTFFITTTVMNFDHIFGCGEQYYYILLNSLQHMLQEERATLFAYVFMPSHVHLVVHMPVGESISDMMRDFKKYTSTEIRQQLEQDGHAAWVERLRANVGKKLPTSLSGRDLPTSQAKRNQVFKLWMDRFDDVVIYNEQRLRVKIKYIHENPVRAGLVKEPEDWKFSSARNYTLGDQSLIYVATDWQISEMRQEVIPDATAQVRL